MASQCGTLTEFWPESDSIKAYLERTTPYFVANSVPDDKQVAILLSTSRSQMYSLLSDLLALDTPDTKSLAELLALDILSVNALLLCSTFIST